MENKKFSLAFGRGFTLIEIVIVFAIIAILLIISMMSWRRQLDKARDAQRKEHLQRLGAAFEDYYNDYECYPPADILSGPSDGLKPYLDKIPSDPITKLPYFLQHSGCVSYRILTRLNNDSDPVINSLNCNPNCGFPDDPEANYGMASSNISVSNNPSASAPPSASPGGLPLYYAWDETCGCTFRGTNPPPCARYWINSCQETCSPSNQCPD